MHFQNLLSLQQCAEEAHTADSVTEEVGLRRVPDSVLPTHQENNLILNSVEELCMIDGVLESLEESK